MSKKVNTKILIVEDEAITAMDLENTLQKLDYEVVGIASTGEEAIENTKNLKPDLVLMDIVLKGNLDGIEATREIDNFCDIPIIYLTAYSDTKTLKRAKSTKPYGFLIKPVNPAGVQASIETALYNYDLDKKLRDSEEKYRIIVETANEGIWASDINSKTTFVNQRMADMLGYSIEEMMGKPTTSFMHNEDIQDHNLKSQLRRKGIPGRYERRFIHKNGSVVWAILSVTPLIDNEGNFSGSFAMLSEITEQKKAEKDLNEHQDKYQALIETNNDFIWEMDPYGRYTYCSPQMKTLWGLNPKDMIGKSPFERTPENERKDMLNKFMQISNSSSEFKGLEITAINSHGDVVYVETSGVPFFDSEGVLLGYRGITRDITERKKIENILKESEKKYKWLFEASPLYLILLSKDGYLIDVNKAACDFVGFSKEELVGKHLSELKNVPEYELALHHDNISRILKGENIKPYMSRFIGKNGDIHYTEVYESPIKKDGQVSAIQIICVDITERRKIEEALKEEKEFVENLIETANVIVLGLDTEGKVTIFNSAAEKITGYSQEEIIGKSFELILPKERYKYVWRQFERLTQGKLPKTYENPILTESGEERVIAWKNNEIFKNDKIVGSISFGVDITEGKKAREALLKSEQRYRDLIELLPQPVYESDLEGNVILANQVGLRIFGFTREDVNKGLNMAQLLAPEEHLKVIEDMKHILNGEQTVREYNAVKKDGTIFPVVVYANPIFHENKIIGSRGVVIDVSELKQKEKELKLLNQNLEENEEKFRALVNNSSSIIRILDKNGLIVFDSPYSSKILGYPEEYFIGKNPLDFIHPEDRQKVSYDLKKVFENKNLGIPTEFRIKQSNGFYHPFESVAQNLISVPGINGVLVITNSILRRKESEDEIIKSLKEKEILLQEIHHRVKNNMQIISSLLNLQKDEVINGESVNVLQESQNRVKSMALIHEKLYKSHNLVSINFKDYIFELVIDMFYSYAVDKQRVVPIFDLDDVTLNIETAIPCGLIVNELVSNSLKYAFPNGKKGKLFVGLKSVEDKYELRIIDDGIGFSQGLDFNKVGGLGLRLVNNLVSQIDGQIELDSTNGVDFKISFKELKYKERI